MKNIARTIKKFINDNLFKFILIIIFFILGIILGIAYSNLLTIDLKTNLINYMQTFNTNILNGEYKLNYITIITNVVKNVYLYTFIIILLGCSIILSKLIYTLFAYKGFSIGFCMSIAIMLLGNIKGTIYGIIFLFFPNILFIFFESIISILWLKFSNNISREKNLYNFKRQIYEKIVVTIVLSTIMIILLIPIQLLVNLNVDKFLNIL